MKILAAVCGIMIVILGVWSTGGRPTETQTVTEIVCLVGGLILCFQAVVIARIDALAGRLPVPQEADDLPYKPGKPLAAAPPPPPTHGGVVDPIATPEAP